MYCLSVLLYFSAIGLNRPQISSITHIPVRSLKHIMEKEQLSSRMFDEIEDEELDERVETLVKTFPNAGIGRIFSFSLKL